MNLETRVGLFMLGGFIVLLIGIFSLGDITFKRQYQIHIIFNTVEGLPNNATVKVSGVEVGKVGSIILKKHHARITVRINRGVKIYEGASASILSTGLIGTKFVSLDAGDYHKKVLAPGSVIYGEDALSYEEIFARAMEGIDELKKTLSDVRGDGAFGRNLNEAMARINRVAKRLDEITEQHQQDIKITLANFKEISEKLNQTIDHIQSIAQKIDTGEGVAAKLVNDPEMGENLKQTIASLKEVSRDAKKVLDRITLFRTTWDYRLRYDVERGQYKNDLGLQLSPRQGKYYFIGVNNVGDNSKEKPEDEDINTFTAEIGKDYGPFTLHAGIIRSKGGFGMRYRPFKIVELSADAYDFAREKTDKFSHGYDTPVYDVGGKIKLTPWMHIGGLAEDVGGEKNFNAYMNIVFEDEDVAYLLGVVGLAR